MKKLLVVAMLLVAVGVFAEPPQFINSEASGTDAVVLEPPGNISFIEVFAPDEDVTVSLWEFTAADTFKQKYPYYNTDNCAECDSIYTVYAGIPRKFTGAFDTDLIYIARPNATKFEVSAR